MAENFFKEVVGANDNFKTENDFDSVVEEALLSVPGRIDPTDAEGVLERLERLERKISFVSNPPSHQSVGSDDTLHLV